PGDQVRAGTWTFDSMVDSARRLTIDRSGDGIPDQAGLRPIPPTNTRVMPQFVMLNGGRIFSPDYTRVLINEPAAIEAIEYMMEINRVGTASNLTSGGAFFTEGRVGMNT